VLVILLGIALGIGAATLRIELAPWDPRGDKGALSTAGPPPSGPAPKVVVDRTEYNFGTVDMDSSGSHDFLFHNAGNAPLVLSEGETSCRCVVSKIDRQKIPPGESGKVTLTWKPTETPGSYEQVANILTNDPAWPQVTLIISGRITALMQFVPPQLVFSRLSVGESATGQSQLFCFSDSPLKILSHKWSNEALARYFDVTTRPLSAEELKGKPLVRNGLLVQVTAKAGLPQGPIQQDLILETNAATAPVRTLPIRGSVGSEIAIVGRDWDPETGILTFGQVVRQRGAQRQLMLVVRGPLRKQVEFKPIHVAPDAIKVSLGQRSEINHGAVVQTPLIVDIPRGSPPASHLGSQQGGLGEIILATTHPQVAKLRILVRFVIEG
jgi:hypothetical protein